ncbi:MAG TPA: nitrogenase component 1 [Methylomusa anaerophila]|uniref:Nitrogenase molybdenum-iron protein beta chain n=1 Tax=Methylomusa anaerophila TaxID=1930071 RepID=A0A348AEL9_9FIRM|nr:nitrogenase component 1 [Methylomusa anaerophila]BBB89517.1 nitrogenase molybdenum-iron protein beta chain [Methylomusa anaerophila]HML90113.1 nitrogenase component 1 [Methylomusa anaerophila]
MTTFIERAKSTCALGGAIVTVSALPKAIPIVHGSGGCATMLSGTYNSASGYKGSGYCSGHMTPTSNVVERDIVFGGEERLEEQIANTIKIIDGDLYFVVSGCQVEIIGDDIIGVARRFKNGVAPVLAANTPGFLGNGFKGYEAVLSTLASEFVEPKAVKDEKAVTILGIMPGQDVFYRGNIRGIKRLLKRLGLKVNTFFGDGETIENIKNYGDAALTIVFSDKYGIDTARVFEEKHDIPYITADLPIGETRTDAFLHKIGERLGIDPAAIKALIAEEKRYYYSYIERFLDIYGDIDLQRYAIVSADINYAFSLTSYLADDLGWVPHLVVINEDLDDLNKKKYELKFDKLGSETKPKVIFEQHAGQLLNHIRQSWKYNSNDKYYDALSPAFLVGSSLEASTAQKIGAAFLPVSFPVTNRAVLDRGYTGYRGGLTLAEDLISALVSNR